MRKFLKQSALGMVLGMLCMMVLFSAYEAGASIGDRWAVQTLSTPRADIWRITNGPNGYGLGKGAQNVTFGEFAPGQDLTYDIGDPLHRVRNVYSANLYGSPVNVTGNASLTTGSGLVVVNITAAHTLTLPAPSAGEVLRVVDGAGSLGTYALTVAAPGGTTVNGGSSVTMNTAWLQEEFVGINTTVWAAH